MGSDVGSGGKPARCDWKRRRCGALSPRVAAGLRFAADDRGAVLRDYAAAVVLAAVVVVVTLTLLAEDLYRAYVRVSWP